MPEVFDNPYFRFSSGVVTFNLTDFLSSSDLNNIFSDGTVMVDFLQAGTYIEHYAIDYVTLSGDVEPIPEPYTMLPLGSGLAGLRRKMFRK